MIASTSQHLHHLGQQVEQPKARSGVQRVAELDRLFGSDRPWFLRHRAARRQV